MCGIAGVAERADTVPGHLANPETLSRLAAALAHRGPDGQGHVQFGRVGLVHTRLAFIDLAGGQQPIFAGPAAIVANGEIYNDLALRAAMPEVRFATGSDCEPPLHLWLREGAAYARALRGMYAIAIHERGADTLVLSRDPFGIKPLYFVERPDGLAFASEPQALLAAGLAGRGVRPERLRELLQLQFTTGADTIFPDIRRVLPGETLRIAGGRVLSRDRLPALPEGPPEVIDEPAALARLDRALDESVDLHCRSEVPYGMFLSGGIDSAAVLAAMARRGGAPVRAFTAAFDVPGAADESEAARAMAHSVGADHEVLRIGASEVWRHLPRIVAAMDDPVADYAIIPSWLLARQARRSVKAVLCGEGGDELFAGYGRYRHAMRPWWRGRRAMRRHGTFDGLGGLLREVPSGWRAGFEAAALVAAPGRSRLAAAQAADVADWLPHDLLIKLDRCLMAHGVEGRTPLIDPQVAAAAFRLPDGLKVRDGRGKYLLRRWVEQHAPAARPFAPKQGFTVPIGNWIAAEGARLGTLVASDEAIAAIAHPDRVRALFVDAASSRARHAAWTLLFYALWHRAHVRALPVDGDVFEVLGSAG